MNILETIHGWQIKAKSITPPEGTHILPARGGLPGPAFFPEGFGLQNPTADAPWPSIMAIGHNFGCEEYRDEITAAGREDVKATLRNLIRLLTDAVVPVESCFMTNWFVGLQPADKQVGEFLTRPDLRYERECGELLLEQIRTLKPEVILLLGLPVVGRAHRIIPALRPWADAPNWSAVDFLRSRSGRLRGRNSQRWGDVQCSGSSASIVLTLKPAVPQGRVPGREAGGRDD